MAKTKHLEKENLEYEIVNVRDHIYKIRWLMSNGQHFSLQKCAEDFDAAYRFAEQYATENNFVRIVLIGELEDPRKG